MEKMYASVLLLLGLVAAVQSIPKNCCFPVMQSWMTDIVAGLVFKDDQIMTETATYGRDTVNGHQGSSKFFTNVKTGVVSTVRKVQKYEPGGNGTFKTWMIYDEETCTIQLKPSAIQNCVPDFPPNTDTWFGGKYKEDGLTIARRQSLWPADAKKGDRLRLEKTLFIAPGCSLSNSLKIDMEPGRTFASLVNYANFRVINDPTEFRDLFDLPDFCPKEVIKSKRDDLFF